MSPDGGAAEETVARKTLASKGKSEGRIQAAIKWGNLGRKMEIRQNERLKVRPRRLERPVMVGRANHNSPNVPLIKEMILMH